MATHSSVLAWRIPGMGEQQLKILPGDHRLPALRPITSLARHHSNTFLGQQHPHHPGTWENCGISGATQTYKRSSYRFTKPVLSTCTLKGEQLGCGGSLFHASTACWHLGTWASVGAGDGGVGRCSKDTASTLEGAEEKKNLPLTLGPLSHPHLSPGRSYFKKLLASVLSLN